MNKPGIYPIITDSFTLSEGTFRFVKYCTMAYWTNTNQQCVEKLIVDNQWMKLSYEESSRIAKLYLKEYK